MVSGSLMLNGFYAGYSPGSGHENVSGLAPLWHAVVVMGLGSLRKPCASCTTSSVATLPVRPTRLSFEDEWEAVGSGPMTSQQQGKMECEA